MWLSLHKADFFGARTFVGLENFARLFGDQVFPRRGVEYVLFHSPDCAGAGADRPGLALALNRPDPRAAAFLRGSSSPPSVLSVTIVTLIWRLVFVPDGGFLADLCGSSASRRSPS